MESTPARTTSLAWARDADPRWDADRERVFGTVAPGVFPDVAREPGGELPGDWWRVEVDGRVVGYGWLDDVWGDAEILLAIEEPVRGTGAGSFALARMEEEARARGLNYVLNVVRDTHPDHAAVTDWFLAHGFTGTEDGALRKQVREPSGAIGQHQPGRPGAGRAAPPDEGRQARYAAERDRVTARPRSADGAVSGPDLGPGHEESGGYVDPEWHQY
jgi:N-acetylglutamate synthase-like GNAT family acetyltransferase